MRRIKCLPNRRPELSSFAASWLTPLRFYPAYMASVIRRVIEEKYR